MLVACSKNIVVLKTKEWGSTSSNFVRLVTQKLTHQQIRNVTPCSPGGPTRKEKPHQKGGGGLSYLHTIVT